MRATGCKYNLLLNRASTWLDVNSYLPYEGKVVILGKTARRVAVRIPSWVNRRQLRATVNGTSRQAGWVGAYQVLDDLKPGDTVQIEFPVAQQTVHLTAKTGAAGPDQDTTYAIAFRGNTVVDITPRDAELTSPKFPFSGGVWRTSAAPTNYPMYLRDEMKGERAPLKVVERCVTAQIAKW